MALSMSQEELLNFALDSGILDLAYVQDKIIMQKREEILKAHPYKIWKGTDGKWRTYLPDSEKGRKLVKRSMEESIQDCIIKYWEAEQSKANVITFESMFEEYIEFQKNEVDVKSSTYLRYKSDYKRFFKGTKLATTEISRIDAEDIRAFLTSKTKELKLNKKALKSMYGYTKSVFFYAYSKHKVEHNPMDFLKASLFYKYCEERIVPASSRVVSKQQMRQLDMKLREGMENNPEYIPNYAVKMSAYTGMRVGELSALRWSDIHDGIMEIQSSEKYDRITKEYYVEFVKNGKERYLPLTDNIIHLLKVVQNIQNKLNLTSEYVFADRSGRVHAPTISKCMCDRSKSAQIGRKSIHSIRRTVNSNLKCIGVPNVVAASMLGHTEEVNENNYTYDITEINERRLLLAKVNANMF